MANEVLFAHGNKVAALAAGRVIAMASTIGGRAATGTFTLAGAMGNNETVTIGSRVYTWKTNLTEAKATGLLTASDQTAWDGLTVTIGSKVYTFQDTLTNVDGNVHIGATLTDTLVNLKNAINLGAGTVGTDYATLMTAHPTVEATASDGTTLTLRAETVGTAGNAIATTETLTAGAFGAATLTGGVAPVLNEVFIGASAAASVTALAAAINATGLGVLSATGTVAHADVSAVDGDGDTLVVTADVEGAEGNDIATTETTANGSFGAATLLAGTTADVITDPMTGFPKYDTYALVTTAGGAQNYDLPAGDEGQEVTLYLKTKGSGANAVVAGAFVGGTALTFDAAGEVAKLKFLNASWEPIYNTGAIA